MHERRATDQSTYSRLHLVVHFSYQLWIDFGIIQGLASRCSNGYKTYFLKTWMIARLSYNGFEFDFVLFHIDINKKNELVFTYLLYCSHVYTAYHSGFMLLKRPTVGALMISSSKKLYVTHN